MSTECRGVVRNGTVVFHNGTPPFIDGTEVTIAPATGARGSSAAVIAAMESAAPVPTEWVDELDQLIDEASRSATYDDPFQDSTDDPEPV